MSQNYYLCFQFAFANSLFVLVIKALSEITF
jgi:hypothetical protein